MFKLFGKKDSDDAVETAAPCTVCGNPAILQDGSPVPPAILQVNEHRHPVAEVPYHLCFCAECLDALSGYVLFAVDEREREYQEKLLMDRLATLDVGVVLTVVEETIHAMPNEKMKTVLENTPFSGIWKNPFE